MAGQKRENKENVKGIKRLDATTKYKAVEIERSGSTNALSRAATKLKSSDKPQKVLIVPAHSMKRASTAMRKVGVSGTVRNISGTRREYVAATAATAINPKKPARKD